MKVKSNKRGDVKLLEGLADEKWQKEEETYQTGKSKTKIRNRFCYLTDILAH